MSRAHARRCDRRHPYAHRGATRRCERRRGAAYVQRFPSRPIRSRLSELDGGTTVSQEWIIVDRPAPRVSRITLNRPDKRNPLSNALRSELFAALEAADQDSDVGVTVIRGAGGCFSAGYDLKSDVSQRQPFYSAGGIGNWPRH